MPWDELEASMRIRWGLMSQDNEGGSHYTQMVQEETTRVGCGIWVDGNSRLHFVCNYLGWQHGGPAFPIENCTCGGEAFPAAVASE